MLGMAAKLRGAVSQTEGPLSGSGGTMTSMYSPSTSMHQQTRSLQAPGSLVQPPTSLHHPTSVSQRQYDEGQIELMTTDMSFSALFMHDLRTRRTRSFPYENLDDIRARSLWQRHDTSMATPSSGATTPMPNIEEKPFDEDPNGKDDPNTPV